MIHRRGFLLGLGATLATPAIVKFGNIMPVRGIIIPAQKDLFYPDQIFWLSPEGFYLDAGEGLRQIKGKENEAALSLFGVGF